MLIKFWCAATHYIQFVKYSYFEIVQCSKWKLPNVLGSLKLIATKQLWWLYARLYMNTFFDWHFICSRLRIIVCNESQSWIIWIPFPQVISENINFAILRNIVWVFSNQGLNCITLRCFSPIMRIKIAHPICDANLQLLVVHQLLCTGKLRGRGIWREG